MCLNLNRSETGKKYCYLLSYRIAIEYPFWPNDNTGLNFKWATHYNVNEIHIIFTKQTGGDDDGAISRIYK